MHIIVHIIVDRELPVLNKLMYGADFGLDFSFSDFHRNVCAHTYNTRRTGSVNYPPYVCDEGLSDLCGLS